MKELNKAIAKWNDLSVNFMSSMLLMYGHFRTTTSVDKFELKDFENKTNEQIKHFINTVNDEIESFNKGVNMLSDDINKRIVEKLMKEYGN